MTRSTFPLCILCVLCVLCVQLQRSHPGRPIRQPLSGDGHRDSPPPELPRALEALEAAGQRRRARGATAFSRQRVALDAVPVAHDEWLPTSRAIRGPALAVVHVARVYVLQPFIARDA